MYSSRNLLAAHFVRKYDRCDLEPGMNCLQPDLADVWRQNAYDGRGVRVQTTEVEILDPMSLDGSAEPAPPAVANYFYTPELTMLNIVGRTTTTISGTAVATSIRSADVIWFGNRPVADHDETTVRYTFTDHLGTPILQTSATATVVWRAEYEPYGNIHTLRTGVSSIDEPLRFPGQQAEYVTPAGEEHYNIFRWYRAGPGRYTQADPLEFFGSTNLYEYGSNNPLLNDDRFGLLSREQVEAATALGAMWSYYDRMRRENFIGADKYYHCLAHCTATRLGPVGSLTSLVASYGREAIDFPWNLAKRQPRTRRRMSPRDSLRDCMNDIDANDTGRDVPTNVSCEEGCKGLRPLGMP